MQEAWVDYSGVFEFDEYSIITKPQIESMTARAVYADNLKSVTRTVGEVFSEGRERGEDRALYTLRALAQLNRELEL